MAIRGVVSDLGGVVVRLDTEAQARRLAELSRGDMGLPSVLRTLRSEAWHDLLRRFEEDAISEDIFRLEAETLLGFGLASDEFWQAHVDIFTVNRPVVALLNGLKASRPDVLLAACSDVDRRRLPWAVGLARVRFDRFVASFMTGHRKPHPSMYEAVCAKTRLAPSELVYVDDLGANVGGARETGMLAHRYDPDDPGRDGRLVAFLSGLGLLPNRKR